MHRIELDGTWRMRRIGDEDWIPAVVPGSYLNDLLRSGLIPDPYYRDLEAVAKKECEKDCEYERSFDVDPDLLDSEEIELVCDGLDTLGSIFLNGSPVASTDDMHRTWRFDVKRFLVVGENTIRIHFASALSYIRKVRQNSDITYVPKGCIAGSEFIRKAHCSFGWDWGPQLPDMGIWRGIGIEGRTSAKIVDVRISQHHENGRVDLDLRLEIERLGVEGCATEGRRGPLRFVAALTSPMDETICSSADLEGETAEIHLPVLDPQLWWPNNLGDHPLYGIRTELWDGSLLLESRSYRIGLREIRIDQSEDQWGRGFCFQVNGVKFFAMGADYIPEDAVWGRRSAERTKRLVQDCVLANFNCLRVWGGGAFPDDWFFDQCDEAGILVWQDLLFACNVYDLTENFVKNISAETADNVRRIRHHACLGLWCGNNEIEWQWVETADVACHSNRYRQMYLEQFERLLPSVVAENDSNTFFWRSSPSSSGGFADPNSESQGDMHIWDVWHGLLPFTAYRKKFPRFCSEFGFESYPSMKTIESFSLPEDRNAFSYVMDRHQKYPSGNSRIAFYQSEYHHQPSSLEEMVYSSQLLQAEAMRHGVEHWRRNRGRCMGAVYWQLNDNWPVASWASLDYSGRWKATHYSARRFFAPVSISAVEIQHATAESQDSQMEKDFRIDGAELHVSNERRMALSGTVRWSLRDSRSEEIDSGTVSVELDAMSAKQALRLDFTDELAHRGNRRDLHLLFEVLEGQSVESEGCMLFVQPRFHEFQDPDITFIVTETEGEFLVELTSKAFAQSVMLDTVGFDCVFSDNWFDLPANRGKTVRVEKSRDLLALGFEAFSRSLSVRSVFDIGRA